DSTAPPPPHLASLMAVASGVPGRRGLFAGMLAACELVPVPAEAWAWSDEARGRAAEATLSRAGLHRVGHFPVLMPFTPAFAAYVDPGRRFYALVCDDRYQRAVTVECRSLYDDGSVYAVTTRAASAASPLPPWRRVDVLAAVTEPTEVVKRFLARRP